MVDLATSLLSRAKTLGYDNSGSGLSAENVQDAIDELNTAGITLDQLKNLGLNSFRPIGTFIAGTSYTLQESDIGFYIKTTNAAVVTITVPPTNGTGFIEGCEIEIVQQGAGQVAFALGAGVTINSSSLSISAQHKAAILKLIDKANDIWDLIIG